MRRWGCESEKRRRILSVSYEELISINPYLKNMDRDELESLIETMIECGYQWDKDRAQFWNSEIQKGVKTTGLDMFTAERFKETYDNAWGNPSWQREQVELDKAIKLLMYSTSSVLLSLLSFAVLDWKLSAAWFSSSVIAFVIAEKKKNLTSKERSIREGTYVEVDKITWCKTCKHFRKIKDFESNLWSEEKLINEKNIPCKIYEQTVDTWKKYYQMQSGKRALYPKDCRMWQKK